MRYFTYNNMQSDKCGLGLTKTNWFSVAEKDITMQSVPGRSGDLIISNNRYKNLVVKFECDISPQASPSAATFLKQLVDGNTYKRLDYSGDTRYYRIARPVKPFADLEEVGIYFSDTLIQFDCKPYKYSIVGQDEIVKKTESGIIKLNNPENYDAMPSIKLSGSNDITLLCANQRMHFVGLSADETIIIDCENQLVYNTNMENRISKMDTDSFMTLPIGSCELTYVGSVNHLSIIPNWRTI